jgi:hypothetical protein
MTTPTLMGPDGIKIPPPDPKTVQLTNPQRRNYEAFIFGNATMCERVAEEGSAKGQTIVICGAGPSLAPHAAKWTAKGDQVWGCNSAAIWLYEQGYPITHGFTIDQTPDMLEEWYTRPPLEYLLASTVHPHLTQFLLAAERRITFFHNYVGVQKPPVELCECGHGQMVMASGSVEPSHGADNTEPCNQLGCDCTRYVPQYLDYEIWMYGTLYPETVRVGTGLNSVTRAIDLALFMGAERVILLGADCAMYATKPMPKGAVVGNKQHRQWLEECVIMHADGSNPLRSNATATTFEGEIDGRMWYTKPDLSITAVTLELWRRKLGRKRLTIIGDTLPNALQGKSEEFLTKMPYMADSEGKPLPLMPE